MTITQRNLPKLPGPLDVQEMFAFISRESQNIISSFSADGIFTYVSPNVEALLGYTPEEVIGQPLAAFNDPQTYEAWLQFRKSLPPDQNTQRFIGRLQHKNGEYRWYETTAQYIRDENGTIVQTIGVGRDITDRKEAEEKIEYLAFHDALTDLPNRRLFQSRVTLVLEEAKLGRHDLMLLDLDGFKHVNDTFGHEIGDQLLVEVARRLTQVLGDAGIVARLGGDEFTVFRPAIETVDECTRLVEQIKHVIAEPIVVDGHSLSVTASVGTASFPSDGDSVEALMRHADIAMYRTKQRKYR